MIFTDEKKVRTSITINPLILNTIKKLAKDDGRTVANYFEKLAKEHIIRMKKGKQSKIS
ncbi:MAG: hypothetical protein ACPG45_10745 [Flavobacteriaceae bacterium]